MFVIVSITYDWDYSLQLGMVKNSSMEKTKCGIWQEHQKIAPISLLARDEQNNRILWGGKYSGFGVLNCRNIIENH